MARFLLRVGQLFLWSISHYSVNQRIADYLGRHFRAVSFRVDNKMIVRGIIHIGVEITFYVTATRLVPFSDQMGSLLGCSLVEFGEVLNPKIKRCHPGEYEGCEVKRR